MDPITLHTRQEILDAFMARRPFTLDEFQQRAIGHIAEGRNVIVSAPTGAGKTVIAEAAAVLALHQADKLFYTTPIKALSNQKYRDFCARWGKDNVGLLTGDQSINGDAPVVVMTTEVLRNMLYAESPTLHKLRYVVMDEVHYLSDAFRGAVWEEVILSLPNTVQLIALSATIGNTTEFANWISAVVGPTSVVTTDFRPVPLTANVLVNSTIYPLLNKSGNDVSRHLHNRVDRILHTPSHHERFPNRVRIVETLERENLLPAIDFIFSRTGCDSALSQCARSRLTLTTKKERQHIFQYVDEHCRLLSEADRQTLHYTQWRSSLGRGFATHHAGMLPLFKQVVEELFSRGLIKVVFATSTLSLGINMPARAVVLEKLTKFNGVSHEELTSSQFAQLIGRAGRRGIDSTGHAIVYYTPDVDLDNLAALYRAEPSPLQSSFKVGYNMVVNLLAHHSYDEALVLLRQSFGQYQNDAAVVLAQRELNQVEKELHDIESTISPQMLDYLTLITQLNNETKAWEKRKNKEYPRPTKGALAKLRRGDVICLSIRKKPILAVVLERPRKNKILVATSNWVGTAHLSTIRHNGEALGHFHLEKRGAPDNAHTVKLARRELTHSNIRIPKDARHEKNIRPPAHLQQLRRELRHHPLHGHLNHAEITALNRERAHLLNRQENLQHRIEHDAGTLATDFTHVCDVLQSAGYLTSTYELTSAGTLLRSIYCETDLICAEAIREHAWDGLTPAELAAVASAITGESRKDTDHYWPPAQTEVLADTYTDTQRIARDIHHLENDHELLLSRPLYGGLTTAVFQWANGATLEECLTLAKMFGLSITPGDFVRHIRQIIDLLSQFIKLNTDEYQHLVDCSYQAKNAIQRGIAAESL
ncbi:RNA helicase [Lawsonella clevelandensis]|uniref:DEAD/DEAH box helicase n=1 Tax=Lawsonella clevelandensis TaxID=1528099 RepID=UPI0027BB068A|nr:DEAD/DEAH box helicase [Lawsonella clevelandensis]